MQPAVPKFGLIGPWFKLVASLLSIAAFLCMGDRSLLRAGEDNTLDAALRLAEWHDVTLGIQEHMGKRQT